MKNNILKTFAPILIIFCTLLFSGCPLSITVTASETQQLNFNFSTKAGKPVYDLISCFDGTSSSDTFNGTIFDTIEIERALFQMGMTGSKAVTKKYEDHENLEIHFNCNESKFDLIKIERNQNGIATKMKITLSPQNLQKLITSQDNVIQKYADLLMAPCFTGDEMSKDEYKELVASLYGNELAEELTSGSLEIKLKNARAKKMTTGISIPLIDILTLTEEKTFTVDY